MTDHPTTTDWRNRAEAAEQRCAEAAKALHDIYWEAMNIGTTHKSFATDGEDVNDCDPSYLTGQALHDFARRFIKPAALVNGVELYR